MNKNIHFLSGLPRCGSTILGSILSQHPDVFVSKTTFLKRLLKFIDNSFAEQYLFSYHELDVDEKILINNIFNYCIQGYYSHRSESHIFDKRHDWYNNVKQLKAMGNQAKIVFLYRPTAEIVTSGLKLIERDPDNSIDKQLRMRMKSVNHFNRCEILIEQLIAPHLDNSRLLLNADDLLFVSYDEILNNTAETLNKIYDYCNISHYNDHDYDNIEPVCQEGPQWGMKYQYELRPKLEKTSWENPRDHLHKVHWNLCQEYDKKLQKIIQDSE